MEAIKVGDVVQLKSGGQVMTVGNKGTMPGEVTRHWFSPAGEIKDKSIPVGALMQADPVKGAV